MSEHIHTDDCVSRTGVLEWLDIIEHQERQHGQPAQIQVRVLDAVRGLVKSMPALTTKKGDSQ